ncbi:MAG: TIGR04282 family arsenosugar biosynthesis glycosyltransferase, partial [Bacteroidota bacterium]
MRTKYTNPKQKIVPLHHEALLLIFTRNPELGKCKTRLAAKVGDQAALDIYKFLLRHTVSITKNLPQTKQVYFSETLGHDLWPTTHYQWRQQQGIDLGTRMENAFKAGFEEGYQKIIVIGSDLYDLSEKDLEVAFAKLDHHNVVLGPAMDGGYYLLGMRELKPQLFQNKSWGTNTVLQDTLVDLKKESYYVLDQRNDVDYYEDIKDIP